LKEEGCEIDIDFYIMSVLALLKLIQVSHLPNIFRPAAFSFLVIFGLSLGLTFISSPVVVIFCET